MGPSTLGESSPIGREVDRFLLPTCARVVLGLDDCFGIVLRTDRTDDDLEPVDPPSAIIAGAPETPTTPVDDDERFSDDEPPLIAA